MKQNWKQPLKARIIKRNEEEGEEEEEEFSGRLRWILTGTM